MIGVPITSCKDDVEGMKVAMGGGRLEVVKTTVPVGWGGFLKEMIYGSQLVIYGGCVTRR